MEYSDLIELYEKLEKTTKRLEKTEILSNFFKKIKIEDLEYVIYLIQGRVFPAWDEREIGMSSKLITRAIALSTGSSKEEVEKLLREIGDLGIIAERLTKQKKQRTLVYDKLSVKKVVDNIRNLAGLEGEGTVNKKIGLVSELLTSAQPVEARFIVRTILQKLRIGVASGILRDAIAKAFNRKIEDVEKAYNLLVDYGEVAKKAKKNTLGKIGLEVGRPIKVMLAIRVNDIEEAFEGVGRPAFIDYKIDGFRVQIHKDNDKILLFTRRMDNVTNQFKELIPILKKYVKAKSCILDTELVGYNVKTKKYLPFQNISQRIKRKYDIEEMAKKYPVEINVFDILYYNGKDLRNKKFRERRKIIEKIIKEEKRKIVLTESIITENDREVKEFYNKVLKEGMEGVMFKRLDAGYKAGRYVHGWVKLKSVMESLNLVIIGGQWGEGKRANWLSSFILGCRKNNHFLEIGKVGTGIKEKAEGVTFKELTKRLKKYIIKEKGKKVEIKPMLIIDIAYEEIQKSPTYSSGYALRFPRVLRIREDLGLNDVDNIQRIEKMYKAQKK